jgi:hypothetical protein
MPHDRDSNMAARLRLLACLLALGTLLASPTAAQTVLMSQDFNSEWSTANPPAGWRIYCDEGDTSANDWHRGPDTTPNRWPDNPTTFAVLDSFPSELGDDSLISPLVNVAGCNVISLRCSTYFRGTSRPYFASIFVAVDGGRFEYRIYDYNGQAVGPVLQAFDLSIAVGHSQLQVAWVFIGLSEGISFWAIDNVSIIGDTVSGVEQDPKPQVTARRLPAAIVRGALVLGAVDSIQHPAYRAELLDLAGRKVMGLRPGANDVSRLGPGVYFVRAAGGEPSAIGCHKVVITN